MTQEMQTSGQFTTLSLWGSQIHYDKKVVQLKEFSAFLEQRAKKSAEDFLLIGQQQKMGWLIAGTDFLEKEMRQVCSEVGEYITAHNILDNPNWELFLQPKIMFADAAKQLTLNLHDTLVAACINNMEEQAQQAYRNSLANSEGLGFGIISNSLTAHFLYAMQAAQKERENEQAAQDAANRVRRNSSPVEKAGELTAKAYHETHEPYVIDSLAQFYGEVESFIYTGADYDKTRLDTLAKEAVETIDTANGTDMQGAIVRALQKDACCGEAVFAAIRYGLVDDDFIKFCDYAPLKLLKNSFKPITAWLKKEKHTNQLYNRSVFGAKTMQNLGTIQRVFLSSGKPKPALYNKILEDVYADEISNAFSAFNGIFHFDNSALERYASEGSHLVVSTPIVNLMLILCNELHCNRLVSLVSGVGLVLPINSNQLHECIDTVNKKIDIRHAEIQEERKEKAIRDAANKAERERIEAEERARKQAEAEKKRQRNTKIIKISAAILIPLIACALLWNFWLLPDVIEPSRAYSEAERLLAEGYYSDAATAFESLGDYKDSPERVKEVVTYMMDDIYEYGIQLMQEKNYEAAIEQFEAIGDYKDSIAKIEEANTCILEGKYVAAQKLLTEGEFESAIELFNAIGDYKNAHELSRSAHYSIGISLLENNQYTAAYEEFELSKNYDNSLAMAQEWLIAKVQYANTAAESIQGTWRHFVGLRSDGTVVAVGENEYGECNVSSWRNVESIAADYYTTFGVCADGTVLSTGRNTHGECNVSQWRNIAKVYAGFDHTVGLHSDGTVVATGNNERGQCNVEEWTNIVDIVLTQNLTIGLRSDGTLCIAGYLDEDNRWEQEVLSWNNIVSVELSLLDDCIWGLTSDSQVVYVSADDLKIGTYDKEIPLVDLFADRGIAVGLKADGTPIFADIDCGYSYSDMKEAEDLIAISGDSDHMVGLKADGTVVISGHDDYADYDVEEWTDIVAIRAYDHLLVGLKANGTLLLACHNDMYWLDISGWTNIRTAE